MIKLRAALRRWFWLLVVGALIGAVVGAVSLTVRPEQDPSYQATSVVLFDLNRSSSAAQEAAQQAGLRVQRGSVPLRAAQILGENDPERLANSLSVDVDGESLSLTIRSVDPDEDQAMAIADAFTTAFLETSNEQELANLDNQIQLLERQVAAAEQRLRAFDEENPLVAQLTDPNVPLVRERAALLDEVTTLTQDLDDTQQQRESTSGPYSRLGTPTVAVASGSMLALPGEPVIRIGLLAGLGLALAALLIALVERWNPRIDSKDEAEESTGLPVLTMVPYLGRRSRPRTELVDPEHFGGGHAESYRRLRSAVQFVSSKPPPRDPAGPVRAQSFLVVSASPGEGKTSTVAFTAFALAEADLPTLAINADCRRPTLHRRLGVSPEPGLTDLAEYRVDRPNIDDVVQSGPIDDLWVVPSGHAGPLTTEIVGVVSEVIATATDRGATVVIDSSPLLATADVMELIPLVDHVLYVIRNGRTTRREALEGLEMLRLRDAPLLGCVCVGSRATKRRYSYYENYYYGSSAAPRRDQPGPDVGTPAGRARGTGRRCRTGTRGRRLADEVAAATTAPAAAVPGSRPRRPGLTAPVRAVDRSEQLDVAQHESQVRHRRHGVVRQRPPGEHGPQAGHREEPGPPGPRTVAAQRVVRTGAAQHPGDGGALGTRSGAQHLAHRRLERRCPADGAGTRPRRPRGGRPGGRPGTGVRRTSTATRGRPRRGRCAARRRGGRQPGAVRRPPGP